MPPRAAGAAPADRGDLKILGLGLAQRATLAARRAGYARVFRLAHDDDALPDITSPADWTTLQAALRSENMVALVIAPATILGETDWLERLAEVQIEGAAWAAAPGRVIMLPAAAVSEALATLAADGGARDFPAAHERLTRRFGAPAALSAGVDPMVVTAPADIRAAERRLLRSLVKDTDGFMARHVERPVSLAISRLLAASAVTPNEITLISVVIGLAGAPFFLSPLGRWQTVGALLLLAHSILDGCDGELARLRFQETRWGGLLDFWGDNVVHSAVFACMAGGWSLSDGGLLPVLLGVSAVLGTLGSASFVYWRLLRPKAAAGPLFTSVARAPARPLARLLDTLCRRDFFYLILVFALFGRANWFLLLTGLGAPIFFFSVLFLDLRERSARISTPSSA
ncbi:MAG TPA: CDP-alcohol phosphatidyltransferase family protein [Alphaproteobacteria bacterium]|nr:CDP-alcohol phosphatidyltransferase family protein [Alphaproteobacteria bacterium]